MSADTTNDPTRLSTELLRARFGEIRLEVLFQTRDGTRVSCVRRASDDRALAYSVVQFHAPGIDAMGPAHQRILDGALLGQTISSSGHAHHRTVSPMERRFTTYASRLLFGTKRTTLPSRVVEYDVEGRPYCRIRERYDPALFRTGAHDALALEPDVAPFLIARLRPTHADAYLRLAHGSLRADLHVGIQNETAFVRATRRTLTALLQDANTHLFVAADHERLIGYVALNVHPALHLNGRECVIRELYVREETRRRGTGTALVSYAERFARHQKCRRVTLATNWTTPVQRQFYESAGFARRCDFVTKTL